MKHLILNNKRITKKIINYLIEKESLPQIQRRLNIYPVDDSFQIEIINNIIKYRKEGRTKQIFVKNKNIKTFFKMIDNNQEYYINDITILSFKTSTILFNTFHGTIISINNDNLCKELEKTFNLIHYDNINDHDIKIKRSKEYLFDKIGNLNSKIKQYGLKTGLDLRSVSNSIKIRLSNISNDYSYLEDYYKFITNHELLSYKSIKSKKYSIDNMSIIIPVYNQDVSYTLLSIQGQNLTKEEKSKLQVIVVNDGSKNDVISDINKIKNMLDYELEIISFNQNMGLSNARNAGYSISKYDKVLFMDSDIILSKNYIYDVNIRMQIIPNAIFTCMRKNIEKNSDILIERNLLKGVDTCSDFDDSRVHTKGKSYHIGCDNSYIGEEISVLDDTDFFKELSFGSQLEIYNISTVVAGHNMAVNRNLIMNSKPFDSRFKGWGMEDAYFSAKLISEGCYVIPVLSSCVYHINHPPRSGSNKQKNKEALTNYKLYNELLNQKWD